MDIRQLRTFAAVAEEESFTYAAIRLKLAQPAVSAQVRQLEDELGLRLFQRGSRQSLLTDAGARLLPLAYKALAGVESIRVEAAQLRGLLSGRLSIGTLQATTLPALVEVISDFHEAHPGVQIALSEAGSADLLAGVAAGRFDVVLAGLTGERPPGSVSIPVFDEAVVLAVAESDPLAPRTSVAVTEVAGRQLIALPPGSGSRTAAESLWRAAGIPFRPDLQASDPAAVAALAARGLGVAVLNESAGRSARGVRLLGFDGAEPRSRVDLLWADEASPAVLKFIELAREHGLSGRPRH
ncbi:MAG: LysR family transcriptional regulator [Renibacterium sp.]|nr:LysR family transcriptional regulator [Renibacterium sp.]